MENIIITYNYKYYNKKIKKKKNCNMGRKKNEIKQINNAEIPHVVIIHNFL